METRDKILSSAQRLVQQRGFNGFSYADIAAEVGIRKASLYHHFSSKVELGLALIESYTAQFDAAVFEIKNSSLPADGQLAAYAALYRGSLDVDRMCLCGMMASDALTLDASMLPLLKRFFIRNTEWLAEVLAAGKSSGVFVFDESAADHARIILSALQGALLIARATGDRDAFDRTAAQVISGLKRNG